MYHSGCGDKRGERSSGSCQRVIRAGRHFLLPRGGGVSRSGDRGAEAARSLRRLPAPNSSYLNFPARSSRRNSMMKASRRARTSSAFPGGQFRNPLRPWRRLALGDLLVVDGEAPVPCRGRDHVILHGLTNSNPPGRRVRRRRTPGSAGQRRPSRGQVHVLRRRDAFLHDVHTLPDHGVLDPVSELSRHVFRTRTGTLPQP